MIRAEDGELADHFALRSAPKTSWSQRVAMWFVGLSFVFVAIAAIQVQERLAPYWQSVMINHAFARNHAI